VTAILQRVTAILQRVTTIMKRGPKQCTVEVDFEPKTTNERTYDYREKNAKLKKFNEDFATLCRLCEIIFAQPMFDPENWTIPSGTTNFVECNGDDILKSARARKLSIIEEYRVSRKLRDSVSHININPSLCLISIPVCYHRERRFLFV